MRAMCAFVLSRWRVVVSLAVGVVAFARVDAVAPARGKRRRGFRRRSRARASRFRGGRARLQRMGSSTIARGVEEDETSREEEARERRGKSRDGTRRRRRASEAFALGVVYAPYEDGSEQTFAGKPLCVVHGKPAVARVVETMKMSERADRVVVATDDYRVVEAAKEYGAETVLVSTEVKRTLSAYAREAANMTGGGWDLVCVVDVEECMLDVDSVDACVLAMEIEDEDGCAAATCAAATDPARIELETRPKCVEDAHGYAMYLSRATIPAIGVKERETMPGELDLTPTKWQDKDREIRLSRPHTHVLGAVCYDAAYLRFFVDDKAEPTPLQRMENIDALRILETGYGLRVCHVNYPAPALKTPADVPELERLLQRRLLESESFSKKSPGRFSPVRTRLFGDAAVADDGKKSADGKKKKRDVASVAAADAIKEDSAAEGSPATADVVDITTD